MLMKIVKFRKFLEFSKFEIIGSFQILQFLEFSKLEIFGIFQIDNFLDFPT